ncbi:MAG: MBL fold metallo-hydrolase [Candidatus Woesearchaeota archaeon]
MSAQIIFLGTAGGSAVTSRQLRSSGGIVLQVEDTQFHLDPGPGALNTAKEYGVNLRANTAILVSHAHLNHCNDLNAVIEAMTLSGLDKKGVLIGSKSVIKGTDNQHPFLTKYHQNLLEKTIVFEKGQKVAVELVEIHALTLEHTDLDAVGFKFFCPRFTLCYLPDTKYHKKLVEEIQGSDIMIINTTYPGNKAQNLNLDSDSVVKILEKVRPRLAIITHFGMEMLKADPIVEARDIQRKTNVQTIAAKDGMIISPEAYSARSPQHRLSNFYQ